VAIISILAAIAIPNFVRFQLRSKAGEGKLNLTAMRTGEDSYFGETGTYVFASPEPSSVSGSGPFGTAKRAWRSCPSPIASPLTDADGFCLIGFVPEGPTYYDYTVWAPNSNASLGPVTTNSQYFVVANSDIDGDGVINQWGIRVPDSAGAVAVPAFPGGMGCTGNAVIDGVTGTPVLGSVGPCGVGFGTLVF
jgi:type IV pilus assembly protein PilA